MTVVRERRGPHEAVRATIEQPQRRVVTLLSRPRDLPIERVGPLKGELLT